MVIIIDKEALHNKTLTLLRKIISQKALLFKLNRVECKEEEILLIEKLEKETRRILGIISGLDKPTTKELIHIENKIEYIEKTKGEIL